MADTVIGGLPVSKGLNIAADVWSLHYDKDVWGSNADEFRPER